jgi:Mg2+ and Co2+ transporter CorA
VYSDHSPSSLTALVTVSLQSIKIIHNVVDELKHGSERMQKLSDAIESLVNAFRQTAGLIEIGKSHGHAITVDMFNDLRRTLEICSTETMTLQQLVLKRKSAVGKFARLRAALLGSKDVDEMRAIVESMLQKLHLQLSMLGRYETSPEA